MTLRAIIIDDEQMAIQSLKTLIELYVKDVKVVAESASASQSIEMIENYKPEMVFLDINMPEMTGFELLEKLQWKNFSLIFTTAYREYALQALRNNAVDYLLKPIDHDELSAAVEKVKKQFQSNRDGVSLLNYKNLLHELDDYYYKNKILVNLKSGIEAVDLNDLVYLESRSNYTQLHLADDRVILTSKTLKEFEDQLCIGSFPFMRVHKSFIVNLKKVTKYLKAEEIIQLNDACKVPLSRTKKEAFYEWMNL